MDEAISYLRDVRDRPVWQPVSDEAQRAIRQPLPRVPSDLDAVFDEYRRFIQPFPCGNIHPRFWGWVNGAGTPVSMLAELLAATMNSNAAAFDQSATMVEEQVLAWLDQLLGLNWGGEGLLVSGGSMANLLGLAAARNLRSDFNVREEGLAGDRPALAVYGSSQCHNSIRKALQLLGLGDRSWREIPVGADYRIEVRDLRATIEEDRRREVLPLCVVASAGTTNTGAIDDIGAIADLCEQEGIWLHVDGAFGALAAISPKLRDRVMGLERADSLALDLHKWLQISYGTGCILVRGREDLSRSFAEVPAYLSQLHGGFSARGANFMNRGIELSRGFLALRVWMSLKVHGADAYARLVETNVAQAEYLAKRVRAAEDLELVAPASLNVVCFRFRCPGATETALDELNRQLLIEIQESGDFMLSATTLGGRFCLRVAITNHRTVQEDLGALVEGVLCRGRRLRSEALSPSKRGQG